MRNTVFAAAAVVSALALPAHSSLAQAVDRVAPAAPSAAPATTSAPKTPTPRQVRVAREQAAREKLASSDPEAMRQALAVFAELGGEASAKIVADRLHAGLPPLVIEPAIDTLVAINRPSIAPVLFELALHRRATVRQRAVMALGVLKVRSAQSALLYCLDDPSPDVRTAAVMALGDVGDQRALSALFAAAEHGMPEALVSVGRIARATDLKLILARVREGQVAPIKPVLQTIMERADYPLGGKVELVRQLGKIASSSARELLVAWLDAFKASAPPPLRKALFDAIKQVDAALAKANPPSVTAAPVTTTVVATPVESQPPAPLPPQTQVTP